MSSYQCKECGEKYTDKYNKWCKPCQINNFKKNSTNWTSGNEKIDDFIQEMRLKINSFYEIVLEWIPYNQFDEVKEISKDDFTKVYSAIWKDGSLKYNSNKKEYIRNSDLEVTLK